MLSPVRFGQHKFRAGGTSGSVFSLIAATLGSGTISFAYAVMMNGYVLGPILIVCGALLSYYTGMLIVKCSVFTGKTRYEDIALSLYGKKASRITSALNLICLVGFVFTYIGYVKTAIPAIIKHYTANPDGKTYDVASIWISETFWCLIFTFVIMFPMSIPRAASALRYSSLFGVLCSMYLCVAVVIVFYTDKNVVPDTSRNFADLQPVTLTFDGVVSTVPLIIFAYMYQVNIPMIYVELEKRDAKQMGTVIAAGSSVAVVFYIMVGIFGYATFVDDKIQLCPKNILQANYSGNGLIQAGNFSLLFAVIAAAPLCVLPSKDTVEELFYKEKGMTKSQNIVVTLGICTLACLPAFLVSGVGDAMALVGASINPTIGFILPIIFYWKTIPKKAFLSTEKLTAFVVAVVITICSILGLIQFFMQKFSKNSADCVPK